jgi:hypothetical protein
MTSTSLSKTCHFQRLGFSAVTVTSRRRTRGRLAILGICAPDRPFSSPEVCHNQTDSLVPPTTGVLALKPHPRHERRGQDGQYETQ